MEAIKNKKYIIKKLGKHDGYYKADPSLAKKMEGMEVVPVGKLSFREEAETRIERKGQPAVVIFEEGTYHGYFVIPELHVESTMLSEVYLTVIDGDTGKPEPGDTKKDALEAIEKEIERLSGLLADIRGQITNKPTTSTIAETAATLIATDSKGTLIVEDDSKLPKTAVTPGFYKVDEDGNPDPSKPGEEPAFAPVSDADKQAKFDRAEAVAEEKRQAALKEKKGKK